MCPLPASEVTFLFTDIEGSTRLYRQTGELYERALGEHYRLLREAIGAHGGVVVKTQGDALFAVFHDGASALAACLDAQLGLGAHPWPPGAEIRVRMGLHTGSATRTPDGDYVGLAVHRAARVVTAAHGGQVLASASAAAAAGEPKAGTSLLDLGAYRLKDFDEPEHLFQLIDPRLPRDFPALRALPMAAHNLPLQRTSFIGREQEIAEVTKLIGDGRAVTILGAGGSGKTRLAFEVAVRTAALFNDGARGVLLGPLSGPDAVPGALGRALGVREEPGRPLLETIAAGVQARHLLIVLDNCEHVIEAATAAVETLLDAAGDVTFLATSRTPLGLRGEVLYRVSPFAFPHDEDLPVDELAAWDAVALFVERARLVQPGFSLTPAVAPAVLQICRRLEGLPLALEFAAARLRSLPLAEVARRLDDALGLLTVAPRSDEPRQRTLRAAIDWSYDLLGDAERTVFRRLSVFRAGATLEAIEAVVTDETIEKTSVMDIVAALVDQSLLVSWEQGGDTRYRMLWVVSEYAAGKAAPEERRLCRRRLAEWCAGLLKPRVLRGPDGGHWLDRFDAEYPNVRVALEVALEERDGALAAGLAEGLMDFWDLRSQCREARDFVDKALDIGDLIGGQQVTLFQMRALARERLHDAEGAVVDARTAVGIAEASGADESVITGLRANVGYFLVSAGDWASAGPILEEAVELARRADLTDIRLYGVLNLLGRVRLAREDIGGARLCFDEVVALSERASDRRSVAGGLANLFDIALYEGDFETARRLFDDMDAMRSALGDRTGKVNALRQRMELEIRQGRLLAGAEVANDAIALAREIDFESAGWTPFAVVLAAAALHDGDHDRAALLLGWVDSIMKGPLDATEALPWEAERMRRAAVARLEAELEPRRLQDLWHRARNLPAGALF